MTYKPETILGIPVEQIDAAECWVNVSSLAELWPLCNEAERHWEACYATDRPIKVTPEAVKGFIRAGAQIMWWLVSALEERVCSAAYASDRDRELAVELGLPEETPLLFLTWDAIKTRHAYWDEMDKDVRHVTRCLKALVMTHGKKGGPK